MWRRDDTTASRPRAPGSLSWLCACLPQLNFITIHYLYFLVVCLVASVVFLGSSEPAFGISYVDSLFLVVSAMTETGLNTVNLSQMTTFQQTILFFLIVLGSAVWVSIWTIFARKHVFEGRFQDIVRSNCTSRNSNSLFSVLFRLPLRWLVSGHHQNRRGDPQHAPNRSNPILSSWPGPASPPDTVAPPAGESQPQPTSASHPDHIAFARDQRSDGRGAGVALSTSYLPGHPATRRNHAGKMSPQMSMDGAGIRSFSRGSVGRNGQFHDLTSEERKQLGGYEYRALKMLALIVPLYSFLWQSLGCIALGAWISNNLPEPALKNGINPWWLGIFNGVSAFNNSGMSLLDANMIPYQHSYFVLITMGLMILAGNTAFPIFLRLIFRTLLRILELTTGDEEFHNLKETFRFILTYPRRVYTNLFSSRLTWWLLGMLVCLNSIDWIGFELLNLHNPVIREIPPGPRALDGLFQGVAVRSGGFYVVPISSLYIATQVLYVMMMYISVYPVVITMRHSNIYEERSLGIYAGDEPVKGDANIDSYEVPDRPASRGEPGTSTELRRAFQHWSAGVFGVGAQAPPPGEGPESRISFISQQVQGQLAHDIWWLVIAVLVICAIETDKFNADPATFSVFNVMFEVVSAFGCVGISVGLPDESYSFSGSWKPASKLILCLVMVRGRHRGLPVALDRAVRLPGEQLHREEEEDHRIRRQMTSNRLNIAE